MADKTKAEIDFAIARRFIRNDKATLLYVSPDGNVFVDKVFADFHQRINGGSVFTIVTTGKFKDNYNDLLKKADSEKKLFEKDISELRAKLTEKGIPFSMSDKKIVLVELILANS